MCFSLNDKHINRNTIIRWYFSLKKNIALDFFCVPHYSGYKNPNYIISQISLFLNGLRRFLRSNPVKLVMILQWPALSQLGDKAGHFLFFRSIMCNIISYINAIIIGFSIRTHNADNVAWFFESGTLTVFEPSFLKTVQI